MLTKIKETLAKRSAARRLGYKMNELQFGQRQNTDGEIVWNGEIFEAQTGREVCPIVKAPVDYEMTNDGLILRTYAQNSNTVVSETFGYAGA